MWFQNLWGSKVSILGRFIRCFEVVPKHDPNTGHFHLQLRNGNHAGQSFTYHHIYHEFKNRCSSSLSRCVKQWYVAGQALQDSREEIGTPNQESSKLYKINSTTKVTSSYRASLLSTTKLLNLVNRHPKNSNLPKANQRCPNVRHRGCS